MEGRAVSERGAYAEVRRLRSQSVDRRRVRIDLRREAAIPGHDDPSLLVDLVDDATVSRAQARVVKRRLDELDPRPDRNAGPKASREKSSALGIHTTHIGFAIESL